MTNCHLPLADASDFLGSRFNPDFHRRGLVATVRFTQNIQRHVACPARDVAGSTLREVLDAYFRDNERARGYVLDERGRLRQHMVVFIDGELVRDRNGLSDPVGANSMIDVIQALSGGSYQS